MLPPELAQFLATTYRRLADLLDTGTCDQDPVQVVVHDATSALADPQVRDAVEELARHGHHVGVRLEIRGAGLRPCLYMLGGSTVVLSAIVQDRAGFIPTVR